MCWEPPGPSDMISLCSQINVVNNDSKTIYTIMNIS